MCLEKAGNYVLEQLELAGFEAYIVGGAVRDKLMDVSIRDIDICTNASMEDIKQIFPRCIDVGVQHGTIIIPVSGHAIEVSEFKSKDVNHNKTIQNDLALRDFTCNALALTSSGEIIDPFGGKSDITNRILKVVDQSETTFLDDPLRLLRGIRFSIQYNFIIDSFTEKLLEKQANMIKEPAVERLANEFEKLARHGLSNKDLKYLLTHKVIEELSNLFPQKNIILSALTTSVGELTIKGSLEWWSLAAFSSDQHRAQKVLKTYKRSNQLIKDVLKIVTIVNEGLSDTINDYHIYQLGDRRIAAAEKLYHFLSPGKPAVNLTDRYDKLPIKNKGELVITGNNLIHWFPNKTGSWFGETMKKIEKAVILQQVKNDEDQIYHWLKKESQSC
ncbi:CCA tRNA nucleotidyltransferase [Evansella tamaricis]|uniref:CCA tRNA nucleotidyltransferase n=1 Tax=Evansella tamaricis TaxID=2069301 RepID=A0ABS6JLS0_9BACI|nr:CCA tRNA nucleotidyltransferase [Evansella tamaricis]MBU9714621.1 CCA tRNA nucleotidyltransferase [Evansella tamaricis]